MEPLVRIRNLTKTFISTAGITRAVEDFSADIQEGEFIALVGPSGCGKSTLLTVMAGLLEATSGHCEYASDRPTRLGYMLQRDQLLSWRTILGNAALGLELQGEDTKENLDHVRELLCSYGLGDFMNSYPSQLSGGMRQRVALIRTLALKPDVMLLDEPFSALDYQTRLMVGDDIAEIIHREKKTAVLVTHDLAEAISFADRVLLMTARPGRLKRIYDINLECESLSRIDRQSSPHFAGYHAMLWKDLDLHG